MQLQRQLLYAPVVLLNVKMLKLEVYPKCYPDKIALKGFWEMIKDISEGRKPELLPFTQRITIFQSNIRYSSGFFSFLSFSNNSSSVLKYFIKCYVVLVKSCRFVQKEMKILQYLQHPKITQPC